MQINKYLYSFGLIENNLSISVPNFILIGNTLYFNKYFGEYDAVYIKDFT